ncbi:MAG: peptide chain release factor N(5)-glutamine methyltransferase [Holophaga sp.]|nr:peptide chain release factor N(5)-glutamine methyltransferase [Holophaga sp.]
MPQTYHQLRLDLATALAQFLEPREANAEAIRWFEEGLGRSRTWMAGHGDEGVPDEVRGQISHWLRRRKTGEPWAYLLGWTKWRGRRFAVNASTLIPRPETEMVLEAALELGQRLKVSRAVDVGTGSGILGISMALETDWEISATDISEGALAVAQQNAQALNANLDFKLGHLLDPVLGPLGLVVSNPPYVDPDDRPSLQPELAWEPDSALFADDHGLALNIELLMESRRRAAMACVLEIGTGQGAVLKEKGLAFGWNRIQVHQDLAGHDRVLMAL